MTETAKPLLRPSIGRVRTGCLCCPPKPETAPMDWQPHPGFGVLCLKRDGETPPEWYEWIEFEHREVWWGSWETGEIKAGPRKGQTWHSWIGGVDYFSPEQYVTLREIEEAVATDPDHDWLLEIHGPMGGVIYQRQGCAQWGRRRTAGGIRMIGRRRDVQPHEMEPGDYGHAHEGGGVWFCCTPSGDCGNLTAHDVIEHEDGTITVAPSILVSDGDGERWHGYLERGVWRLV